MKAPIVFNLIIIIPFPSIERRHHCCKKCNIQREISSQSSCGVCVASAAALKQWVTEQRRILNLGVSLEEQFSVVLIKFNLQKADASASVSQPASWENAKCSAEEPFPSSLLGRWWWSPCTSTSPKGHIFPHTKWHRTRNMGICRPFISLTSFTPNWTTHNYLTGTQPKAPPR